MNWHINSGYEQNHILDQGWFKKWLNHIAADKWEKKFFLMASTRWHNLSTTTSLQLLNGAVLTDKCLIHWDQWFGCMSVIITNMLWQMWVCVVVYIWPVAQTEQPQTHRLLVLSAKNHGIFYQNECLTLSD